MNALRIRITASWARNVSMKTVHFVVIATLGLLKTVLSAKVIIDSNRERVLVLIITWML